jgi:hypothetical protein
MNIVFRKKVNFIFCIMVNTALLSIFVFYVMYFNLWIFG